MKPQHTSPTTSMVDPTVWRRTLKIPCTSRAVSLPPSPLGQSTPTPLWRELLTGTRAFLLLHWTPNQSRKKRART